MMNDSGWGGGGGWGEDTATSGGFGAKQAANISSKKLDRIPIPVLVKDLSEIPNNDENVIVGSQPFSTVRVVGKIVNVVHMTAAQQIEYHLKDTDCCSEQGPVFVVVHYLGVDGEEGDTETFVEDTVVRVVGKLRSFDDRLILMAFNVHEVTDIKQWEIHRLETKLASLYYAKNVSQMAADGKLSAFVGTMLRGVDDSKVAAGSSTTTSSSSKAVTAQSKSTVYGQGVQPFAKKAAKLDLDGQSVYNRVKRVLEVEGDQNEHGLNFDEICQLACSVKPEVEKALQVLCDEGHVYQTIDENHYQTAG